MYRKVSFAVILTAFLAFAAFADGPPVWDGYAGGWGMCPLNWQTATGSFSAWGLYDPNYGGGGGAWVVGWLPTVYITYAPITLDLWIEMYASQSYHYTSYKWHRLGNAAEIVTFIIEGLCQSNNGQYISLTKGTEDLTYLWFKHNIFNGNSPTPAPNIPLTWRGRWGDGLVYGEQVQWGWTPITPNPNVTMLIDEVCDHWFQFEGTFEIPYHQPDGHYQLTMAGCPAPEL